ncbi:MAG: hypothetical protein RSE43_08480 [Oscillospiraceae bacterium]
MSQERSLRNCGIIFTSGQFFDLSEPDGMVYSAAFPMDGKQLKEIMDGFDKHGLCIKEPCGYLQDGDLRVPFTSLTVLDDFLNHIDTITENGSGEVSIEKIRASLELERCGSVDEARHVVDCIDDFDFIVGVSDCRELGEYTLRQLVPGPVYAQISGVLDAEQYGRDYIDFNDYRCGFVSTGFVERSETYRPLYELQQEQTM